MSLYEDSHRALHEQFDSARMAALLESLDSEEVQEQHKAFIESRDMFWLATVDSEGRPQCQYKGGAPGFVRVIDPKTLVFPSYDGNGRYHSMGNIGATAKIGMLFLDFETPNRLRLQGEATVSADDPLLAEYKDAELIVRVAVTHVIINCPRYIHRMRRIEVSPAVPAPERTHLSRSGSASTWYRKPCRPRTRAAPTMSVAPSPWKSGRRTWPRATAERSDHGIRARRAGLARRGGATGDITGGRRGCTARPVAQAL
ncbi:MAG: pyridoxamine 5'-phosphate oxidase family protein [Gammaproteobacteria bacterium]